MALKDEKPKTVPISCDYDDSLTNWVGNLLDGVSPQSKLITDMFRRGYMFDIAPQITHDGVDENGEYVNPQLLGISIITTSARKIKTQ